MAHDAEVKSGRPSANAACFRPLTIGNVAYEEMALVSVIIVTWNSVNEIGPCLRSLLSGSSDGKLEIIVVDNNSSDGTLESVRRDFPTVSCLSLRKNVGFAAGSNRGIESARGRWILLLNPDTEVFLGAIKHLVERISSTDDVAAVAPRLLNPDGTLQTAGEKFLNPREYLLRRVLFIRRRTPRGTAPYLADWVSGACLLIRREVLTAVGLLNEAFSLYAEDMEWCWRAWTQGWKIEVVPEACVVHRKGASARQNLYAAISFNVQNSIRWFRFYGGEACARWGAVVIFIGLVERAIGYAVWKPKLSWLNLQCAWELWGTMRKASEWRIHAADK